jgi:PAS domain S-box-containing protein
VEEKKTNKTKAMPQKASRALKSGTATAKRKEGKELRAIKSSPAAFSGASAGAQGEDCAADITRLKETEEALRASSERYRSYIEVTGQLGWTTNPAGEVVEDMPSWRKYTGQTHDEIKGWGWAKALHPEDIDPTTRIWKKAVRGKRRYETEYRIRRHDGIYRYFMACGIPVFKGDGSIREWVGTCVDITERTKAEQDLKRAYGDLDDRVRERTAELAKINEELEKEKNHIKVTNNLLELFVKRISLREYLDAVVHIIQQWSGCSCLGIRVLDKNGEIPYKSSAGFSQDFLKSENFLTTEKDQCACIRAVTEKAEPQDLSVLTPYGSFFSNNTFEFMKGLTDAEKSRFRGGCVQSGFRSVAVVPLRYQKKVIGVVHLADEREGLVPVDKVKFIENLSYMIGGAIHKFNAEKELKSSQKQLRDLTSHLQAVREDERTSISREIHDELGQSMTALKMDLFWIKDKYSDHGAIYEKSKAMLSQIDEVIRTVKKIITELRPGILDHLGISAAVEWQAAEFQKMSGIRCGVVTVPEEIILSKELSTNIFRIFQEILTNVMRHARATHVKVLFEKKDGRVIFNVEDNGKGITDKQIFNPSSFGIIGMRERIHAMNGDIRISGAPDKGTSISINIPLPAEKDPH